MCTSNQNWSQAPYWSIAVTLNQMNEKKGTYEVSPFLNAIIKLCYQLLF